MNSVQLIEYIKYFTLKGSRIGFNGNTPKDIRITKEKIITPEGHYFYIENFLIDNHLYTFDKDSADFEKRNITFDLFLDKSNVDKLMIPNLVVQYENGGNKFRVYIFNSTFYKTLPENIRLQNSNLYGALSYMESYGSWTFPYSLIITIKDVGASFADFELFLNMNYNAWKNDFNAAIQKASSTDKDFKDLIKYPIDIFERELDINTRIALIEILAYNEIWDLMGWGIDFDGLNEQDFVLQLIESTPDKDAYTLYLKMFSENAKLFKKLDEKFENFANLKFIIFLVKTKYKEIAKDGEKALNDYLVTIPDHHIVPVRRIKIKPSLNLYGPYPIIELLNNKIKIHRIDMYIGGNIIQNYTSLSPDPFKHLYKEFPYDEMLKIFIWSSYDELGLSQGRILPLPAFAIKAFSKALSDDITLLDVANKVIETIGIILPFYKLIYLLEEIAFMYEIAGAFFEAGNAMAAMYVSAYFEDKLKKMDPPFGMKFLKAYNYFNFIYSNKGISKEIKSGNFIALKDGENLMTLWSDFYFLLTEPQKDYLNEKKELEDLKSKIDEIDFAIKSVKK